MTSTTIPATSLQVFCHHSWLFLKLPCTSISFDGTCNQFSNFALKKIIKRQLISTSIIHLEIINSQAVFCFCCAPIYPLKYCHSVTVTTVNIRYFFFLFILKFIIQCLHSALGTKPTKARVTTNLCSCKHSQEH